MSRRIETALLVDDDDAFRTMLQGSMRRRGVRARTAATVAEGLVALEYEPADLVVIDYRMPRQDGLGALTSFRRLVPECVIIMLTGYGDIPLAVAAVKAGADTLMTKPVDADRLLREASAVAERPRVATPGTTDEPAPVYNLDELEREAIRKAMLQSGGVVASAAKLLGIDRRTLQRKLRRIS
ncbi:MAG: DNA-binding response regulator [Minicystis sp.]